MYAFVGDHQTVSRGVFRLIYNLLSMTFRVDTLALDYPSHTLSYDYEYILSSSYVICSPYLSFTKPCLTSFKYICVLVGLQATSIFLSLLLYSSFGTCLTVYYIHHIISTDYCFK